jgi:hypothetical protein
LQPISENSKAISIVQTTVFHSSFARLITLSPDFAA